MASNEQTILHQRQWATSVKGLPIELFSSKDQTHPLLMIGGVHGDEPEGVWLAEATLNWLKSEKKVTAAGIASHPAEKPMPWILIPCLNPDGFEKRERTNGHGVDLNRNYPSRDWSPEFEKPRYHPGPRPGSEPEIQALVALIQKTKPRMIIHFHSWEPCIVYTGAPGESAARALHESSGYELKTDIGYPTTGSLSRYGWHDLKIPIICIEEKEHTPQAEIWPHFSEGLIRIINGKI